MMEFCYSCSRIGHMVNECSFKDEKFKKAGYCGPWLRAPSSKKSVDFPAYQQLLPGSGAIDDNLKNQGRRVKNLAIKERQDVLVSINPDDAELKVSDHTRSKMESSLISGSTRHPRTNQTFSTTAFNDICPFPCASTHEKSLSILFPLTKPTPSLSSDMDHAFHCFSSNPIEMFLIESGEVVNFVFSPGSNDGPSNTISRVEKQFKGKASGVRRLSGIKHDAREKHGMKLDRSYPLWVHVLHQFRKFCIVVSDFSLVFTGSKTPR
ncbi:hypothetical protein V6N12_049984 [Hibiscus sabdariffa]|uniref:CCHC-type domain-containing protein n=1 Tax=Hibiscus sabdariffa TaxID=183260 RepID=A0ABR2GB43_9ROSI